MKYLSVCSGIEAATVAWHPLGWEPLAFSEIEKFPRQVLAHHYPDVLCHGDFTVLRDQNWIGDSDLLVGGTPCQAFSVAGLRNSLSDDRGNLTLEFVRLADAIDNVRHDAARPPAIIVWENVPGVLSVKDNAFGCFLAALTGNNAPLIPTGGKWTNAGMVVGPKRSAAWRVLDAQYFGVAQRRRRVFVVASARDGFDPAEILFEREGVRRDSAPSRSAGQKSAPTVTGGPPFSRTGNDRVEVDAIVFENRKTGSGKDIFPSLMANVGTKLWLGNQEALSGDYHILEPQPIGIILHGSDGTVNTASYTEVSNALLSRAPSGIQNSTTTAVMQPIVVAAFKGGQGSAAGGIGYSENIAPTLSAGNSGTNRTPTLLQQMAVRRLTPRECERLQGFPDDYTAIPNAADGPRYKALGNSMAVPVMAWIGKRIDQYLNKATT